MLTDSVTCRGDSGHGVVVSVRHGDKTEWMLRGITSKSFMIERNSSRNECDTRRPSVLTDVDVFRQWVNDHISRDFGRLNSEKFNEDFRKIIFYENPDSVFQITNIFDINFNSLGSQNFEDLKTYWQIKGKYNACTTAFLQVVVRLRYMNEYFDSNLIYLVLKVQTYICSCTQRQSPSVIQHTSAT
jgi:hypothetical protein